MQARSGMPETLRGVWYEHSADGKAQCAAYRRQRPSANDPDGIWNTLIGATVITSRRIHQVAEYGEGNFYAINQATALATNDWRIDARLSIDVMSDGEGEAVSLRLTRSSSGLLFWRERGQADAGPFFLCGPVRSDLYP